MKKSLLIVLSTLLAAQATASAQNVLFSSGFDPDTPENYAADMIPPGWNGDGNSTYPVRRWSYDPERAPEESSGYFGEVVRQVGDTTFAWHMTSSLSLPQNIPYELSFDFKVNTDPAAGATQGNIVFHLRDWPAGPHKWLHVFNGTSTIGEEGWVSGIFDTMSVSEPDAHGWRRVVVTGTTSETLGSADIWCEGWSNTGAATDFSGSYGIDNVSFVEILPEMNTVVGVALFPAHEVEFMATAGKRYQIESTTDGESWGPASEVIIGNDQFTTRMFSTRDRPAQTFRVLTD